MATQRRAGRSESPELRRLRRRIDALDRRIVELLNERARVGLEVGWHKALEGRPDPRDAEREREVLARVSAANAGPLPDAALLALYRRLIEATRRLEADALRMRSGGGPHASGAHTAGIPDDAGG